MIRRIKSYYKLPIARKDGLEYKDMETAFNHISTEIENILISTGQEVKQAEILVFGGACCVMALRNRKQTKDIDFYSPDPVLTEAISDSKETLVSDLKQRWPHNWVNSEMSGWAKWPNCDALFANSIENNVVLYESKFLKVYAADWKFQLLAKITRAYEAEVQNTSGDHTDKKDLGDAVAILNLLVGQNGGQPLDKQLVRSWYNGGALEDKEISYVNSEYYARYKRHGIL